MAREIIRFGPHIVEGAILDLLHGIGEDRNRDGLTETPERVAKAWAKWTEGYDQDPSDFLKSFEERDYDEMVIVKDIPIYSKCEHHLADIFGTASIAYIPDGRVLGLSKLSRVANIFARRLQGQERMTVQIADALFKSELKPKGVGVVLRCRHMCMESRGICQQGHHTETRALRGVIAQGEPRAEFIAATS
jgi:GTP cyclohydrolase I